MIDELKRTVSQHRESIKVLRNRIDVVLKLHRPDGRFHCVECCRYASFAVPYPCATAIALGEV